MTGMATTGNIDWDGRLESFKGKDTTHYVTTAAGLAKTCAACRGQLVPGERLSLVVDIAHCTAPDGSECLTFTDCVCHRRCSDPVLRVRQTPWAPDDVSPLAVRAVFTQKSVRGRTRIIPVLAFTLVPVITFQENGGEQTSALVSLLLSHGFALAMNPDYAAILEQAQPTATTCGMTLTPENLLLLTVNGNGLYREQLDARNPDDAEWINATAQAGQILIISGDNLHITDTALDLRLAARHGTLVTGTIPISTRGWGNPA